MKTTTTLPGSVQHQLNMYALAATAAGVSMLALTPPSEAKVVYTKAHIVLHRHQGIKLDLNHDGVPDLALVCAFTASSAIGFYSGVFVPPLSTRNRVNVVRGHIYAPSALPAGMKVGSPDVFIASGYAARAVGKGSKTVSFFYGNWANSGKGLQNRYLGVRFAIKKTTHYGWVRMSVSKWPFVATLTGYAYETVPNKPIVTGKTKGPDVDTEQPDMTSFTLGRLALGRK
jgi:hypothetical protein